MIVGQDPCPCGSGARYDQCCQPYLADRAQPPTAVALMRSRYTAYVVGNHGHLLRTWHPSTRPATLDLTGQPPWCRLDILRTEEGRQGDDRGLVEFVATARAGRQVRRLREISRFVREAGRWLYVAGDLVEDPAFAAGSVGRNDPCPCTSGRKFKKCCGR